TCVVQYHGDLKGPCVSTLPSIRHPAQRGLKEKKKKKDKKEKKKTKRYSESPAYCGVEFVVGHMETTKFQEVSGQKDIPCPCALVKLHTKC
ncbi:hypothetical protein OFM52_29985, partial [Escherichia coli]|nr:hypothetical protein [Escherichia coli]